MNYENRLLKLGGVVERTALSKSSIYRKMEIGDFPKPVNLGGRTVRWLSIDIDNWIAGLPKP
jgi:prophage regulatory protein